VNDTKELTIYQSEDSDIKLEVELQDGMVWLSRKQIAELFGRDVKTIGKHINNALKEELQYEIGCVAKFATQLKRPDPRTGRDRISNVKVSYYNLDMILSVGYRVKSREGVAFRKWATQVLQNYVVKGYALNDRRLDELKATVRIMRRTNEQLDATQVLDVIEAYTNALELLDNYDHRRIEKPDSGSETLYLLSYEECRAIVDRMHGDIDSELFGRERDGVFEGTLNTIYSTFDGVDLYPTIEEKAAHLLYFLVKDHGLHDGNKRVATAIFLEFLYKNNRLMINGRKIIEDHTLVALVIMIAESISKEKDLMVNLVMNFLNATEENNYGG
jgi:prophage maintenance system killer protein